MLTLSDVNPILEWEMRTLARRRRYYFIRVAFVAALLAVLYWTYEQLPGNRLFSVRESTRVVAWFSNRFFETASVLQILAILVLTPVFAGAAIVGDVERRTLDDLLTTSLSGWEIVVGKWATRTLLILQLVLAGAPFFGLMILMGGVGIEQVALVAITAIATAASTAAISIRASVAALRTRQAIGSAYVDVIYWLIVPPTVSLIYLPALYAIFEKPILWDLFLVLNPLVMTLECNGSIPIADSLGGRVVWYVVAHAALVALQLRRSAARLRAERKSIAIIELRQRAMKELQLLREVQPPGDWPIFWKEWNFGYQWPGVAVGMFCLFIYGQFLFAIGQLRNGNNSAFVAMSISAIAAAYLTIALRLAPCVTAERERGCWIPLLTTPLSGRQIVLEKLLGGLRPLQSLLILLFPYLVIGPISGALTLASALCLIGVVAAHALFIAGVAITASMRSASTTIACVWTLAVCCTFGGGAAWSASAMGWFPYDHDACVALSASVPRLAIATVQQNILGRLPMSPAELQSIYWSYLFTIGYAATGAGLLTYAIADFDRCAVRGARRGLFIGRRKS